MESEKKFNPRYYSLDFWRGVACLTVIAFHSTMYVATLEFDKHVKHTAGSSFSEWIIWASSRLWIGVPVFFVISGYCIAASADLQRRNNHPAKRYFARRMRRIYPPLWAFLFLATLLVAAVEFAWPGGFNDAHHAISPCWDLSAWQWAGSLTLTESWRHHLVGDDLHYAFAHLWTLCYEEQFYLVIGLLLMVCRGRLFTAGIVLTAIVVPISIWVPEKYTGGFFFDGKWLQFAAGMGVYWAVNYAQSRGRWIMCGILGIGVLAQFAEPKMLLAYKATPNQYFAIAYLFGIAMIALYAWDRKIHESKWTKPISWCGVRCYSLYLTHWPIAKLVSHAMFALGFTSATATLWITLPISTALSIIFGAAFYEGIERRFLNSHQLTAMRKKPDASRNEESGTAVTAG